MSSRFPGWLRLLAPAVILGFSVGCSPAAETSSPEAPAPASSQSAGRSQIAEDPGQLQQAIEAARSDLAVALEMDMDSVSVLEAAQVTWRSGAVGCPEPEVLYTQALVAGYRIVLQSDSQSYTFHAKRGGQPFLCPQERAEPPVAEQPTQ